MTKTVTETYSELGLLFKESKSHDTFTKIYNKMKPGLTVYVNKILKDSEVTDDVVSRTFEKMFTLIDQYDPKYSIATWAYTIAYREAIKYIRRERNIKTSLNTLSEVGVHVIESQNGVVLSDAEDYNKSISFLMNKSVEEKEDEIQLKYNLALKAIDELKPIYKDILIDVLLNGLKYKDVAYKMEPKLLEMQEQYDLGELNDEQEKEFLLFFKRTMQKVKNRVRRGRLELQKALKADFDVLDI